MTSSYYRYSKIFEETFWEHLVCRNDVYDSRNLIDQNVFQMYFFVNVIFFIY